MASNYIYKVLRVALLGVGLMLSACVNTLELAVPNGRDRSQDREQAIRNAVAYYDNHRTLITRSADAEPTEEAPFVTGDVVVDWESAVTLSNEEKRYTDFSMRKDNRFYLLLEQESEQREAVELYSRFASVEDFGLDTMNQYVATYIPDVEYLQSYYNVAHDYGINCAECYEFSGVVMYTRPSGHYVAAYRYEEGILAERSFLYNKEKTTEENIADFCSVMEGLTLGVAVEQEGTRGDDFLVYIEHIIVVDNITGWQAPELEHLFPEEYEIVEPSFENLEGAGGGGGGSSEKEEDEPTGEELAEDLFDTSNLSEEQKKIIGEMLVQITKDCMGEKLYEQLRVLYDTDVIIITYDPNNAENSNFGYADSYHCGDEKLQFNSRDEISQQTIINLYDSTSDVLLHEMFHAYQLAIAGTGDNFSAATANYEIEAQLAKYYYTLRNKEHISVEEANKYYYTKGHPWSLIADLSAYVYFSKTSNSIFKPSKFASLYKTIVQIYLHSKIKYTYTKPSNIEDTILNLTSLSGDC